MAQVEAFLTLLKVIEENNLIRYASVKRAIATWTSLIDIDNADKITKKKYLLSLNSNK